MCIFILLGSKMTLADDNDQVFGDSELGDVVYSQLNSENFRAIHSDDWVQLSGDVDIEGTELCERLKVQGAKSCKLKNFSGKFLRVIGDKSGAVGEIQECATKLPNNQFKITTDNGGDHRHAIPGTSFGARGQRAAVAHGEYYILNMGSQKTDNAGFHNHSGEVCSGGDNETRPDNIALYAYIRVNTKHSSAKKIAEALKELEELKRRECPPMNTGERTSLIACYFGIACDFLKGSYLMADGELSRVTSNISSIMCSDSDELDEKTLNAFEAFIGKYGASNFLCE